MHKSLFKSLLSFGCSREEELLDRMVSTLTLATLSYVCALKAQNATNFFLVLFLK